ncbi:hypothetical protein COV15_01950 [Candidatus Woesearchaeota archaeon CG10_big_fil_rev_8_21_14_0_10_34_12]|nr:MAG: hypothetical protein COV15_01950 [Candidatus Woesearchaeota archaeon CG10_big_fil_rev_8_21_14_0_10_34_12]
MIKQIRVNRKRVYKFKMRGKRGWLRIVEAFMAILLISGVLVYVMSEKTKTTSNEKIEILQKVILKEISDSEELRQAVINEESIKIDEYVSLRIPSTLNYELKICDLNDVCRMENYIPENVYVQETVISSSLDEYNVKKVKLFVW